MKKFLAIYLGTPATRAKSGWDQLDPAKRKQREEAGIRAWHDWMTTHKSAIDVAGGPLGKTKRVGAKGVSDSRNAMTGFVVIEAESHEAAARMFEGHPHFTIFPGEAVEVMECLPNPGRG